MFGGRRIHAKLFHADIDARGPMRLNRPAVLAPPDAEALKASTNRDLRSGSARTRSRHGED